MVGSPQFVPVFLNHYAFDYQKFNLPLGPWNLTLAILVMAQAFKILPDITVVRFPGGGEIKSCESVVWPFLRLLMTCNLFESMTKRLSLSLPFMRKFLIGFILFILVEWLVLLLTGKGNYCVYTGITCLHFQRAPHWLGASADAIGPVIDTVIKIWGLIIHVNERCVQESSWQSNPPTCRLWDLLSRIEITRISPYRPIGSARSLCVNCLFLWPVWLYCTSRNEKTSHSLIDVTVRHWRFLWPRLSCMISLICLASMCGGQSTLFMVRFNKSSPLVCEAGSYMLSWYLSLCMNPLVCLNAKRLTVLWVRNKYFR